MKLDNKRPTKSTRKVQANPVSMAEINKYFELYHNYATACKMAGLSTEWGWMLKNGFYQITPDYAKKMSDATNGIVSYAALMTTNPKVKKTAQKNKQTP